MKYPLPLKILFVFVILLTILGFGVKISFGNSLMEILSWLLPTTIILSLSFFFVRNGQKKRENYHSKFSSSSSDDKLKHSLAVSPSLMKPNQ